MTKMIRKGVFETNSSSAHSVSVAEGVTTFDTIYPNEDGSIQIDPIDFGWDYDTFYDAESKLAYLLIYIRDWVTGDDQASFKDRLFKVVSKQTGCTSLYLKEGRKAYGWRDDGYIDHQSVEERDLDFILEDEQKIKEFVFSGQSSITTDNDNH